MSFACDACSRARNSLAREWLIGAGVIAGLFLVLVGTGWLLGTCFDEKVQTGPQVAVAEPPAATEPAPQSVPSSDRQLADASKLSIAQESSRQNQPDEPDRPDTQQQRQQQSSPIRLMEFPFTPRQTMPQPVAPPMPDAAKPIGPQLPAKPATQAAIFMGLKAMGKRICIIADCSGSMAFNNRMTRLKLETRKTLRGLSPEQDFYFIYFSSTAIPMPAKSWRHGGKDVERILPWIGSQQPEGNTEPMPAFERAFRLDPRPDVIFFLTDGLIPITVPQGVARLNGEGKNKVPINTILFGGELASVGARIEMVPVRVGNKITMVPRKVLVPKMEKDQGQLEKIAKDSGGMHRFVPDQGK